MRSLQIGFLACLLLASPARAARLDATATGYLSGCAMGLVLSGILSQHSIHANLPKEKDLVQHPGTDARRIEAWYYEPVFTGGRPMLAWDVFTSYLFAPMQLKFDYDHVNCWGGKPDTCSELALKKDFHYLLAYFSLSFGIAGVTRLNFAISKTDFYKDIGKDLTSHDNILVIRPEGALAWKETKASERRRKALLETARMLVTVKFKNAQELLGGIKDMAASGLKFDRIELDVDIGRNGLRWPEMKNGEYTGKDLELTYDEMGKTPVDLLAPRGQLVLPSGLFYALTNTDTPATITELAKKIRQVFCPRPTPVITTSRFVTFPKALYEQAPGAFLHFLGLGLAKQLFFDLGVNYHEARPRTSEATYVIEI